MLELDEAATFLFVPADRPDRFHRAATSGADMIIIDLEDAVAPADRPASRSDVRSWLCRGAQAVVRVNAVGTSDYVEDVRALGDVITCVMLPKTESAAHAERAAADFGGAKVVALVETASGVLALQEIASSPVVGRIALGNVDLATDLGVDADDTEALATVRSMMTLASAAAGLPGPIDGVTRTIDDITAPEDDARRAVRFGFRGKLCIHPRQVGPVRVGFTPAPEQVSWAHLVLAQASEGGARSVEGAMVDRPVEERARDILRRAVRDS